MDDRIREFGERLAATAIAQDWAGVHAMLAPWLQSKYDVPAVQRFFEDDYRQVLAGSNITELHYPEVPYVSGNSSTLDFLREKPSWKPSGRPIDAAVTDANFRQWMTIQLQTSEEQQETLELDFLTDLWLVVVELESGLRVGYWSHDPYESG